MGRKKNPNGRWIKGNTRHSPTRKIEDSRWVRQPDGKMRLEIDMISELGWIERRKEQHGWFHGARVRVPESR